MSRSVLPRFAPALIAAMAVLVAISGCAPADPDLAGAQQRMQQGNYQEALELAQRAIENDPNNAAAYRLRGDIYMRMAQQTPQGPDRTEIIENMMASYDRAEQLSPGDALLEISLMQAYGQEMQRAAEAWEAGTMDPARFMDAARGFQQAGMIRPDSAAPHMYHGLALLQAGETTGAAEPLQRAVDLEIDAVEAYFYLGQIYLVEDRADEAIRVLEAAVDRFPDNVEVRTELLNAYAFTGQIDRALQAYASFVRDEPDDPVIRYNYGSFLLQAGRFEEAAEQLQVAAELDPMSGDAQYNLGAAYLNHAVDVHERLVELDAGDPQVAELEAERNALLQRAIGPLEAARQLFQDQQNIQDACSGLFRAYALLQMNEEARQAAVCAGIELD